MTEPKRVMDVVALDVGGTAIKAARIEAGGAVAAELTRPTPRDDVLAAIESTFAALRTDGTAAVGIVVPGVVEDGVVRYAVNLGWRDVPVRDELVGRIGLPVAVGHDVTAAAVAECAETDGLFVALGTGIAAAYVAGGVVSRGASGRAGELGHVPVWPDGVQCRCGQQGCLEAYASAAAIARRYTERSGSVASAPDIVARIEIDTHARDVWQEAVDALAIALAHEVMMQDPAAIVLGGGLAGAGNALLAPLRAALATRLLWRPVPDVTTARLGAFAGRAGAAALAWRTVDRDREGCPV